MFPKWQRLPAACAFASLSAAGVAALLAAPVGGAKAIFADRFESGDAEAWSSAVGVDPGPAAGVVWGPEVTVTWSAATRALVVVTADPAPAAMVLWREASPVELVPLGSLPATGGALSVTLPGPCWLVLGTVVGGQPVRVRWFESPP